jgi:hypothetical protein
MNAHDQIPERLVAKLSIRVIQLIKFPRLDRLDIVEETLLTFTEMSNLDFGAWREISELWGQPQANFQRKVTGALRWEQSLESGVIMFRVLGSNFDVESANEEYFVHVGYVLPSC